MARPEVIDDLAAAEALAPAWDELAQDASLPLCAPGWTLPWWRHMAPAGSRLRIVAVRDGDELIAVAPWFAHRGPRGRDELRFLGAEISDRVDVLCMGGREREAAVALRKAVARMSPSPDLIAFEAVPADSNWTRLLSSGGGRMRLARYRNSALPAPAVTMAEDGGFETWMAGRSGNFRSQMRRMGRRLESRDGGVRQLKTDEEMQEGIAALLELHLARWSERGESGLARPGVAGLLADAARALGPDRMRLWAAEIEGRPISVQLFLAAGSEVKYWNGGWAEQHADLKPSMLTILAALQDAIGRGERRLDLGVGTHEYKQRFADTEDTLTWGGLVVRNRRWIPTRLELAPMVLRYRAKLAIRSLPESLSQRLEGLAKRGGTRS
ncbi:MAG TPA: GNAT family N-acetyltransferase [Solirubrobacteraceae bacterium]|jgi:CelD/BcsL family acetyltransferase involved in cellulose biosynthesis|nr:GNAT family N-acetyltransferase [Solirubrobacteraceae bacterium]